jgi:hypothetical protein
MFEGGEAKTRICGITLIFVLESLQKIGFPMQMAALGFT